MQLFKNKLRKQSMMLNEFNGNEIETLTIDWYVYKILIH